MPYKLNIFTGTMDLVNTSSGGTNTIPEYTTDPVAPAPGTAWVLKAQDGVAGQPIGLLLALTYAGGFEYWFSYETTEGTVVRTPLTQEEV